MDRAFARSKKLIIRDTEKAKDSVSLKTIKDRYRQFLIEKIIYGVEFSNPYANSIEKKQKLLILLKRIIKYQGCVPISLC